MWRRFLAASRSRSHPASYSCSVRMTTNRRFLPDGSGPPQCSSTASISRWRCDARQHRRHLYARHQAVLDRFSATILELGRLPYADELDHDDELLAATGSVRRAFAALPFADKERDVARVAAIRKDDLLVYLALNIFERRHHKNHHLVMRVAEQRLQLIGVPETCIKWRTTPRVL